MTEWEPATEAEAALRDALRAQDQELYFRVLSRSDLVLPVSGQPVAGGAPAGWGTWTTGGRTHVLAFTSEAALRACLADTTASIRRVPYYELAENWPNLEWWLAVNPGLPIEGYLPAWFVSQLARGDIRLPGRTMGARARLERAESAARARATAAVPRPTPGTSGAPNGSGPADVPVSPAAGAPSAPANGVPGAGPVPVERPGGAERAGRATVGGRVPPKPAPTGIGAAFPTQRPVPAAFDQRQPPPAPEQRPVAPTPEQRWSPVVPGPAPAAPPGVPASPAPGRATDAVIEPTQAIVRPLPRRTTGPAGPGGETTQPIAAGWTPTQPPPKSPPTPTPTPTPPNRPDPATGNPEVAEEPVPAPSADPPLSPWYAAASRSTGRSPVVSGVDPTVAVPQVSPAGAPRPEPAPEPSLFEARKPPATPAPAGPVPSPVAPPPAYSADAGAAVAGPPGSGATVAEPLDAGAAVAEPLDVGTTVAEPLDVGAAVAGPLDAGAAVLEPDEFGHAPVDPDGSGQGPVDPAHPGVTDPVPDADGTDPAEESAAGAHPDFVPANDVEESLLAAAGQGSTDTFLSTLLLANVLLPVAPDSAAGSRPGDDGFVWRTETLDDETYVVVFTSTERLNEHLVGLVETVPVKFVRLINRWPEEAWSFAVNPGTPVGAKLPGSEIVALANWAAEVGLGDDSGAVEPADPGPAPEAVEPAPRSTYTPSAEDSSRPPMMQKTLAPSQVSFYLERGYDRVSGFVHRVTEVSHLNTPAGLYAALGLGYPGSPFTPDADEVYVLRWPAYRPSLYRIPYGGQNESAMRAMEGWVIERPPFRGNGFAPGESSDVVAEFKVDSIRLPNAAELWRIRSDGSEKLVATFDSDTPVWRPAGED